MRYSFLLIWLLQSALTSAQTFKTKLNDHSANVEALSFSTDGKYMASGAWDGHINLYVFDSLGMPVLKTTFKGHLGAVTCLNFSNNSKYLVSSSKDYTARIWNIDTPSKHKVFNLHLEPVSAAFLDPSNKNLITGSLDASIKTTPVNDPLKTKTIKVSAPVLDLQLSKDMKYYIVALKGGLIKTIETAGSNAEVLVLKGHTDDVNAIDLSPNGSQLASASNDKTIIIWDLSTGKSSKVLNGFSWKVTSVKFSSDGKYLLGGCNDGTAQMFELSQYKSIYTFKDMGSNVRNIDFSRNGQLIAIATFMTADTYGLILYQSGITCIPLSTPNRPTNKATTPKKTNGSE